MPNNKEIAKNKICWVEGCDKEIKEWPHCEKHYKMTLRGHKLDMKVPSSPKSVGKPGA